MAASRGTPLLRTSDFHREDRNTHPRRLGASAMGIFVARIERKKDTGIATVFVAGCVYTRRR